MQFVYENPHIIVAIVAAVEILRGNGPRMGDQIKEGMMTDPLGKIMLAIVTGLIFWVGNNTQGNSLKLAALEQKMELLAADRFTSAQAALLSQRLDRLEREFDGRAVR